MKKENKNTLIKYKYSARLEESKINYLKQVYNEDNTTKLLERLIDERIEGIQPEPKKITSPIIRIGGKSSIAHKIVAIMPKHRMYVDVFGGAGHILFAKPKESSVVEVFNDKSQDIVNLFECIKTRPFELRKNIAAMPCSRAYFNKLKSLPMSTDKIERAARFFYIVRNSFYGDGRSGWRASTKNNASKTLQRIANELYFLSERLKYVTLECHDWKYILRKYDNENTLFYVDPPYIIRGKPHGLYDLPFSKRDGRELAKRLHMIKGMGIVSHYENALYDKWYSEWDVCQIPWFKASGKTVDGKKPAIIENLYCNFDLPSSQI
jgi:DNA adenine methylase